MANKNRLLSVAALTLVASLAITSCSSSKSTPGTTTSSGGATVSAASLAAAQAVVDQYSGKPTRFPVDQPLTKGLAPGQKIAYLQCPAPFCALLAQLYGFGTKTMGIAPVTAVQADSSANGVQTALSSIEALKPSALLLPAVNLGALGNSLSQLHSANVKIIGAGVMGSPAQGIDAPVNGPNNYKVHGALLADWAIVTAGAKANIAFYGNPELDFTQNITDAFKAELAKNCSTCTARFINIPVATIGSTAPSRVVSDLQAHPNTQIAVFGSLETATGLPAALKVANIKVKIAGSAPVPVNLQDLKTGGIDAAVGLDAGVLAFTQLDAAVRLATGQPLTDAEVNGDIPSELITGKDLPADVSNGFSAYPDFVQRFKTLWAKAGTAN